MPPAALQVVPTPTDPQAFARLYADGFASVWRLLQRLGVPSSAVEDAAHDVFVIAWRRLGEFSGRSSLKTWLLGIAVRVASDHRRKNLRSIVPLSDDLPATGTPEEHAGRLEVGQRVQQLLGQLRPERREVLVLVDLEELSAPEVAEALGMNLNTVYTRLRAARQDFNALAAALQESSS